jgi:hypothetical protein
LPGATVAEPEPPRDVVFGFAVNPTATSAFNLELPKPAVAAIVDVVYRMPDGAAFVARSVVDRPLGDGARKLEGKLGGVRETVASTSFRVWYVEYEDGTSDGALDPSAARQALEPFREALKAHARRYAGLARTGRSAVEEALKQEPTGPAVAVEQNVARGWIQASVEAFPRAQDLAARFEQAAR